MMHQANISPSHARSRASSLATSSEHFQHGRAPDFDEERARGVLLSGDYTEFLRIVQDLRSARARR